ncbi:hypothetical protein RGU41_10070 [Cryobacterium sp. 10C3]|nr:hypothetical protein [Cryobacterium sp. 10C3]MDY7557061.1 hypothetical protein [Cryobacterium sp. 10C3]
MHEVGHRAGDTVAVGEDAARDRAVADGDDETGVGVATTVRRSGSIMFLVTEPQISSTSA